MEGSLSSDEILTYTVSEVWHELQHVWIRCFSEGIVPLISVHPLYRTSVKHFNIFAMIHAHNNCAKRLQLRMSSGNDDRSHGSSELNRSSLGHHGRT